MVSQSLSPLDPSSFSRPELVKVTNIFISLNIDIVKRILVGNVVLTVQKLVEDVTELILDVKELKFSEIFETELNDWLQYTVSPPLEEFGSKLTIKLPQKNSKIYVISIQYETAPNASGLQWLEPSLTTGKKHPFVFSQFQTIHARSVLPCQDTPCVKTKYSAVVLAPNQLTVLMSARRTHQKPLHGSTLHHFVQDVPVPSYLIALAIGALESRKIGPRSHVWAEKELIEAAAHEFADIELQLKAAEDICGPYEWGTYDLLILPPTFPGGGMEHPNMNFVTSTLLAGDRSLANVIAHEIAHSWAGNLVTLKNFEHCWLNEGLTVFIERRILSRLEGPQHQDLLAYCGLVELKETINQLGETNPLTQLVINLKEGIHPDDTLSNVAYEKGQIFIRYLENLVGGPDRFEPFLRHYLKTFKYTSIDTNDFKEFFSSYFANSPASKQIDWSSWLYLPGLPPIIPLLDMTLVNIGKLFKNCYMEWDGNENNIPFSASDLRNLKPWQIIFILQEILDGEAQSISKLQQLERVFEIDISNSEITFRWFSICLKARWENKINPVLKWVNEMGRIKFIRPLYRDLFKWKIARFRAIKNFRENCKNMMRVTAYTIAKELLLS